MKCLIEDIEDGTGPAWAARLGRQPTMRRAKASITKAT